MKRATKLKLWKLRAKRRVMGNLRHNNGRNLTLIRPIMIAQHHTPQLVAVVRIDHESDAGWRRTPPK
jgi:hypothetical protein